MHRIARRMARPLVLALATLFVAGCWSDKIEIRSSSDNDHVPYASRSAERKALMKKLGKAPPEAAKPAAGGEGHH